MSKYDIILDKLEEKPDVPMIIGKETISFSEIKQLYELTKEEAKKVLDKNTGLSLNKKSMLELLSDSYRERIQNKEMQNENSFQKKFVQNKSYMNNNGFIDLSLFFFMVLTSALSILNIMLFVIKSHL